MIRTCELGRSIGVPPLVDRFSGFEGEIAKLIGGERYALGVVEHFWCAAYHPQIAALCAKTVLDLHNIESEWHERCAGRERWPISAALRRFGRKALEMERALLARYSLVLAASGQDAARVREIAPEATVFVYPNTIPWVGEPPHAEENAIVFSGNMEYLPNVQAVRHFRRGIWPILRRRHEGLRWRLIGKNPQGVARFVRDDPRIELRGPVEDAVSAIAPAKAGVVPVVSGSGTRLKILEMWAAGIPVVSTALGAEGLGAEPGSHLLVADQRNDFADCVSELLSSEQRRREHRDVSQLPFERSS